MNQKQKKIKNLHQEPSKMKPSIFQTEAYLQSLRFSPSIQDIQISQNLQSVKQQINYNFYKESTKKYFYEDLNLQSIENKNLKNKIMNKSCGILQKSQFLLNYNQRKGVSNKLSKSSFINNPLHQLMQYQYQPKQIGRHSEQAFNNQNVQNIITFQQINPKQKIILCPENQAEQPHQNLDKKNIKKKIPFFQPFKCKIKNTQKSAQLEIYLRSLAQKGMIKLTKQMISEYQTNKLITRKMNRKIGKQQIEYIFYNIDTISIESLTWIIESIKLDKMTPSQKLIQTRIKQSFDIKIIPSKWEKIIKYLDSPSYKSQYESKIKQRLIPEITVIHLHNDILLELKHQSWEYEDQSFLDESEIEWMEFRDFIKEYFNEHSEVAGGKYGLAQYIKTYGSNILKQLSLGKLNMYVQEAITKGFVRYEKTSLVSNSKKQSLKGKDYDEKKYHDQIKNHINFEEQQTKLKIMAVQVALIKSLMQNEPRVMISLAQIPCNIKRYILFQLNLIDLGFPKLKNLLSTIEDKITFQTTKTHLTYEISTNNTLSIEQFNSKYLRNSQQYCSLIVKCIQQIVQRYQRISLENLYYILNEYLKFTFDYAIFNVPSFYDYIMYYCHQFVNIQYCQGVFIAFNKFFLYKEEYQFANTHENNYCMNNTKTDTSAESYDDLNFSAKNQSGSICKDGTQKQDDHLEKEGQNYLIFQYPTKNETQLSSNFFENFSWKCYNNLLSENQMEEQIQLSNQYEDSFNQISIERIIENLFDESEGLKKRQNAEEQQSATHIKTNILMK